MPHPNTPREGVGDRISRRIGIVLAAVALVSLGSARPATAQIPTSRFGEVIPRDVREMYDRAASRYLATTQSENGDWPAGGRKRVAGTTGMARSMVFLASGEDPNFGQYSNNVRRSLRNIIQAQDAGTGILGMSMYHHGFATLALAEAYGVVNERNLWPDGKPPRSIGQGSFELAVRRRGRHVAEEEPHSAAWQAFT